MTDRPTLPAITFLQACGLVVPGRRLLKPGGIHLIRALDHSPGDTTSTPDYLASVFAGNFHLQEARRGRKRVFFVATHWYTVAGMSGRLRPRSTPCVARLPACSFGKFKPS